MNALDFTIVISLAAFFALRGRLSLAFYLPGTLGAFGGYVAGLALAVHLAAGQAWSDTRKGFVALGLMIGLAALLAAAGFVLGKRLHSRIVATRLFAWDKRLAWPYKGLVALAVMVMLSQTLLYVPLLGLQFEAQGSLLLGPMHRFLPMTPLGQLAQDIAPQQFHSLRLGYDPDPLTYDEVRAAGQFQAVLERVAPSVVKVSGRNCVGLGSGSGFVAAPGLVVTNVHVISGASSVYIRDHRGAYPATPLVIDRDHDLAVLYSAFITDPPLRFADQAAAAGTPAVSLGYPGGGDLQMVAGRTLERQVRSLHNALDGSNTVTFSTSLGRGSSGGPLVNAKGEVIGINDAGGPAFAIAIRADVANRLVNQAKHKLFAASTDFCEGVPSFY